MLGFAFAVIPYSGNDYIEKLMPLSQSGIGTYRFVVMGSGLTVTADGNSTITTFTINGVDYKNSIDAAVTAAADDRYYIVYTGKKTTGSFSISGTNDWTTQTNTTISLPFSQSGASSNFYQTTASIDSVTSSNMDILIINNVNYSNQTVTTLPARIGGTYYIYYGTTSASGSLSIRPYIPILNMKLFIEGSL